MEQPADFNKIIKKNGADLLNQDGETFARAVKLRYVNDRQPGISRVKKGKTLEYRFKDKQVKDAATLQRIKTW